MIFFMNDCEIPSTQAPVRGAGGVRLPSRDPAHLAFLPSRHAQGFENVPSDVFRRRIDLLKVFQVVQELVIQLIDHFFGGGLDSFEIHQDAVALELFSGDKDFDLPVVPCRFSHRPSNSGAGERRPSGDDLQFIHGHTRANHETDSG